MSYLLIIPNGSISEGTSYKVLGTGGIQYDGLEYLVGSYFTGTTTTTYSLIEGTPYIIENTITFGSAVEFSSDFYIGLLPDDSWFLGTSLSVPLLVLPEEVLYFINLESNNTFITFAGTDGSAIDKDKLSYNKNKIKEIVLDNLDDSLTFVLVGDSTAVFKYYTVVNPETTAPFDTVEGLYNKIMQLINE